MNRKSTEASPLEQPRNSVFNPASIAKNPKKGDPTSLNVSALPGLKREVKRRLSRKEVSSLSDFDFETYVIELALIDVSYYKSTTLPELVEAILAQIRKNPRYWIEGSEVHQAIIEKGEYVPTAEELAEAQNQQDYENTSMTYASLRDSIRVNSQSSIWALNQFMRVPRLPIVLAPMVFRFIRQMFPVQSPVSEFYLQNLVLGCFLRARHHCKIELTQREVLHDSKNVKFRKTLKLKANAKKFEVRGQLTDDNLSLLQDFALYCREQENVDLAKAIDTVHEFRLQEEELLSQALKFLKEGYFNFISATGPIYERVFKMTPFDLDDSSAFFYYDLRTPPSFDAERRVDLDKVLSLRIFIRNAGSEPGLFTDKMHFTGSDWSERLANALERNYNSPSEVKKRSYRYFSSERTPWSSSDFEKFYEAIEIYNSEQLANKKIARHIGPHIDPNHVRYERQLFNQMKKQKTSESLSETTSLQSS